MTNIFVGNLSYSATEDSVRSLFEQYGAVERVSIVTDRDSGQPRGFGFVEMTNHEEAQRAIEAVNGQDLGGRALNVNEARPKSERGPRADLETAALTDPTAVGGKRLRCRPPAAIKREPIGFGGRT
jgi:cold-inducible RNA-binding protein